MIKQYNFHKKYLNFIIICKLVVIEIVINLNFVDGCCCCGGKNVVRDKNVFVTKMCSWQKNPIMNPSSLFFLPFCVVKSFSFLDIMLDSAPNIIPTKSKIKIWKKIQYSNFLNFNFNSVSNRLYLFHRRSVLTFWNVKWINYNVVIVL